MSSPRSDNQNGNGVSTGRIEVFGEPWVADQFGRVSDSSFHTPVLDGFALNTGPRSEKAEERSRRVLACVNFCAGEPTENLTDRGLEMTKVAVKAATQQIEAQRELIEDMKEILWLVRGFDCESFGCSDDHEDEDGICWPKHAETLLRRVERVVPRG